MIKEDLQRLENGKHLESMYEDEMRKIVVEIKTVEREVLTSKDEVSKKQAAKKLADLYERFFKAGKNFLEVREHLHNLLFFMQ